MSKLLSLKRGNNVPKLPGVDYVVNWEKLGTSRDVGSFLERIVVERANDDLC